MTPNQIRTYRFYDRCMLASATVLGLLTTGAWVDVATQAAHANTYSATSITGAFALAALGYRHQRRKTDLAAQRA